MDYADYIDRTDYDRVDAVRKGIDADAGAAALKAFYDNDIDGITENITGHRVGAGASEDQATRLHPVFYEESVGPGGGSGEGGQ